MIHEINLTTQNLELEPGKTLNIRLTYTLPSDTVEYRKTLTYDIGYLSVTFDDREISQIETLSAQTSFALSLYRPTEAPLSLMYLVIIFVLVVILIAST